VPSEIAKDEDFLPALDAAKETARKQLVFRHLNEIPAFSGLVAGLKPVDDELNELEPVLSGVCAEPPDDDEDDHRTELEKTRCVLKDLVTSLRDQLKDENKGALPGKLDAKLRLRDDSPTCVEDDTCSALKKLRVGLETWAGLLRQAGSAQAAETADRVR